MTKKPTGPPELVKAKASAHHLLCGEQAVKATGIKYTMPTSNARVAMAI